MVARQTEATVPINLALWSTVFANLFLGQLERTHGPANTKFA